MLILPQQSSCVLLRLPVLAWIVRASRHELNLLVLRVGGLQDAGHLTHAGSTLVADGVLLNAHYFFAIFACQDFIGKNGSLLFVFGFGGSGDG